MPAAGIKGVTDPGITVWLFLFLMTVISLVFILMHEHGGDE